VNRQFGVKKLLRMVLHRSRDGDTAHAQLTS